MDVERWTKIRHLFEHALTLDGEERGAYLASADGEADVLDEVRRLLDADEREETAVESAAPLVLELLRPAALLAELGATTVDPYRIVRPLGRGGMGAVYLAERADGTYQRRVALKLVHGGYAPDEVMRRFRSERRILAGLEHPNIARMYDAGVASDGRPFLVMEYVEGESIDRYADRMALDLRQRLGLMLQVYQAVQYAHRSLIIHRDLKPSNVLVGPDGAVKLLDFGIAKLTEDEDVEPATRADRPPLTPEYASPEQLRGDPLSTATDVYSLGAVLYQLVAGVRPFGDAGAAMAYATGAGGGASPIVVPSRAAVDRDPARGWARELRGDLDRVTLKALAWDPAERYPTVEAFADDLRCYLDGRPVSAQPPRMVYRARKFVGRHRAGVAGTSIAVAGLLATTWIAVEQAQRARAERDTAVGVSEFLEDLFRASDPRGGQVGESTSMATFLELAVADVQEGLDDQPATRARLLYVLGSIYRNLSRPELAMRLFRDAIAANRAVYGAGHADEIQSRELLGLSLVETGAVDEGLAQLDSALTLQLAAEGEDAMLTWRLRERLGQAYATVHRNDEALPHLEAVTVATRRARPFESTRLASALNVYGSVLAQMGRYADAASPLAEAADLTAASNTDLSNGPRALDEGVQRGNLAFVLLQLGTVDEAEREMRRSLELLDGRLPPGHQLQAQFDVRLAEILNARWQDSDDDALASEADALYARGLEAGRALPQLRDWVFFSTASYGRALGGWSRLDEAESALREALAAGASTLGPEHPLVWATTSDLGAVLARAGRIADGLALTEQAFRALEAMEGAEAQPRINVALNHGRVLIEGGRREEGLRVLEQAHGDALRALAAGHRLIKALEEAIREAA